MTKNGIEEINIKKFIFKQPIKNNNDIIVPMPPIPIYVIILLGFF